jgi:hypothetical protein
MITAAAQLPQAVDSCPFIKSITAIITPLSADSASITHRLPPPS